MVAHEQRAFTVRCSVDANRNAEAFRYIAMPPAGYAALDPPGGQRAALKQNREDGACGNYNTEPGQPVADSDLAHCPGLFEAYIEKRIDRSIAMMSLVRDPVDMKSTPVSA